MTKPFGRGTRIAGTGRAVPARVLTNKDLEKLVDTSDEWIVQRTGIRARHMAADHETVFSLGRDALLKALARAGVRADELDLIIVASVSGEMLCPSTAARISDCPATACTSCEVPSCSMNVTFGMLIRLLCLS